jgi:hypothetical protein
LVANLREGFRLMQRDSSEFRVVTLEGNIRGSVPGIHTEQVVISPHGDRFVSVEREEVVVRAFDPLREIARAKIERSDRPLSIGFLSDGPAVVFSGSDCKVGAGNQQSSCAKHQINAIESSGLVPLRDMSNVHAIAFAQGGNRALMVDTVGRRSLIDLPSGTEVMKFESVRSMESPVSMAIDENGSHVMIGDDDIVVYALRPKEVHQVARLKGATAEQAVFGPEGRSLYLSGTPGVVVLREGVGERDQPIPRYDATPPAGFRQVPVACAVSEGDNSKMTDELCRSRQAQLGVIGTLNYSGGGSRVLPDGHVRSFTKGNGEFEVFVTATDPAEFPNPDDVAWSKQIVASDTWGQAEPGVKDSIRFNGKRAFEYAEFWRHGCDPRDIHVRVIERDGFLYKVRLEVPPGTPQKQLVPLFEAFFNKPFEGPSKVAHAFQKPPKMFPGPC